MATINISNLSFAYDGGDLLFDDVSLRLDTRWKLGLIGRNGRGKTTLLRLLLGELPFDGNIDVPIPLGSFPYEVDDESWSTLQVVESIAEFEPWQLERELSLLDVSESVLERPFETLSGGEKTKVLLAALFLPKYNRCSVLEASPDRERSDGPAPHRAGAAAPTGRPPRPLDGRSFLLIDEPTNHLDLEGRETVARYLDRKSGFILISHDRTLLDRCVDHVLSINRSDVELIQGNFSTWQQNRDYRDKFEESADRKLRRDIKRLEEAGKRSAEWSGRAEKEKYGNGPVDRGFIGAKAAGIMNRAKAADARRQQAVDAKSALFSNVEVDDELSFSPLRFHSTRLVDLTDVSLRFEPDQPLFDNLSLSIDAGDRVALCGRNGCGKSSLLKLIAGEIFSYGGSRVVPPSLKISYVPQDSSFLVGSLRKFLEERELDESFYRAILHKFGFDRNDFENDLAGFSAGQKKKVLLAASLSERAHLYLWDEPLNYIDVISRIQIENMLRERGGTVVFIEHDRSFLDAVATKRIVIEEKKSP